MGILISGLPWGAVSGILFFLLASLLIQRMVASSLRDVPGPFLSKWTTLPLQIQWVWGRRAKYVHALHQIYGPVVRLSPNEIDISDLKAVRQIHQTGSGFLKASWYQKLSPPGVENLFVTTNPQFHSRHRRLLSTPLSDSSLRLAEPLIDSRVQLTIQRMREQMDTNGVVDVYKWWVFMSTDIIGELSFGESFELLENGKRSQLAEDVKRTGYIECLHTTVPSLVKLATMLPIPFVPEIVLGGQRMLKSSDEAIEKYKHQLIKNKDNPKMSLFTKLFNSVDSDSLTYEEIRDEAFTYLLAGSSPTGTTLTYLVWAVCQHKEVQKALVSEVCSLPENFTDQDVRRLPYLEQVINETLRLYAIAPSGLARAVPSSGAELAGFFIPAGVTVSTQAYTLHRDPKIFPDPLRFDPSRWANSTKEMRDASMPFGGGSRICVGLHLARRQIRLATAYFFRTFPRAKVSTQQNMSDSDMEQLIYFMMAPKGKRCLVELA